MLLSVVSLLSLGALGYCYTQDALNDQIVNLPGAENLQVNFNQFSGYLTVAGSKHMHYWMVGFFATLFILYGSSYFFRWSL